MKDEVIFLTHTAGEWCAPDTIHHGFLVTEVRRMTPTALITGDYAACWEVRGVPLGCQCLERQKPMRWRNRWRVFKKGLHFGYPLCCVIRFSLDRKHSGLQRGSTGPIVGESGWVPCGIFHKHHPNNPPCNGKECKSWNSRSTPRS